MSLTIKEVKIKYGEKTIIEDINFSLNQGEIGVLIGRSGCGKTSLIKAIAGIKRAASGVLLLNQREINSREQRIGYIPQNYGLIPWEKVRKNVLLPALYKQVISKKDLSAYESLMEELEIKDCEEAYPSTLSGGQKQRVAIARALLLKPELMLMDEPFSSLDPFLKEEARQTFLKVWYTHQVTTLLVTHDLKEAIFLGHQLFILSGSPASLEVINNPFVHQGEEDKALKIFESSVLQKIRGEADD